MLSALAARSAYLLRPVLTAADKIRDFTEHTVAQAFAVVVLSRKMTVNLIEPLRRGRSEMHIEPRLVAKPGLDFGMLAVWGVVAEPEIEQVLFGPTVCCSFKSVAKEPVDEEALPPWSECAFIIERK